MTRRELLALRERVKTMPTLDSITRWQAAIIAQGDALLQELADFECQQAELLADLATQHGLNDVLTGQLLLLRKDNVVLQAELVQERARPPQIVEVPVPYSAPRPSFFRRLLTAYRRSTMASERGRVLFPWYWSSGIAMAAQAGGGRSALVSVGDGTFGAICIETRVIEPQVF